MHADEFPSAPDLRRAQFPAWADRSLRRVPSADAVVTIDRVLADHHP